MVSRNDHPTTPHTCKQHLHHCYYYYNALSYPCFIMFIHYAFLLEIKTGNELGNMMCTNMVPADLIRNFLECHIVFVRDVCGFVSHDIYGFVVLVISRFGMIGCPILGVWYQPYNESGLGNVVIRTRHCVNQ